MPTPTMPKRTRSLGANVRGEAYNGSGSRTIRFATAEPAAAAALLSKNCRREKTGLPMMRSPFIPYTSFFSRALNRCLFRSRFSALAVGDIDCTYENKHHALKNESQPELDLTLGGRCLCRNPKIRRAERTAWCGKSGMIENIEELRA